MSDEIAVLKKMPAISSASDEIHRWARNKNDAQKLRNHFQLNKEDREVR